MGSNSTVQLERLSVEDRQDIDQQVQRILQHPLFHQSKRLPAFLRYIVNESLNQGGEGSAKERTLGIEVFGRKPDYDNNSDPIVRVTASELRKKLAQYYYEDGHGDEIRIELPPGAYLPRFRRSLAGDFAAADEAEALRLEVPAIVAAAHKTTIEDSNSAPDASASSPRSSLSLRRVAEGVCLLLILIAAVFTARSWRQSRSLDGFWAQIAQDSDHVFIVMPVIGSDDINVADRGLRNVSAKPALSLEDTNMAVRVASQLEKQEGNYQLVSSSEVTLDQLRMGPSVLIGALDNIWTMRLAQELPFVFEEAPDNKTGRIIDSTSADRKSWSVDIDKPHTRISHDYGIVARYRNRLTGRPTVVVAGISSQGTQAAGELVTSSEYESIRAIASKSANFEVIVETEAVDGHSGPPRIVAQRTW
jgi:hypothetical protein